MTAPLIAGLVGLVGVAVGAVGVFRLDRADRWARGLILVAAGCWAAGYVVEGAVGGTVVAMSWPASALHATAVVALAGLMGARVWKMSRGDVVPPIDGLIFATSIGLVGFVMLAEPMLERLTGATAAMVLLAGLGGTILLGAVVTTLAAGGPRRPPAAALLLGGAVAMAASEIVEQVVAVNGVDVRAGPLAAALAATTPILLCAALWMPGSVSLGAPSLARADGTSRIVAITVGALVAPGLILVELVGGAPVHLEEGIVAAVLLIGLTMSRTAILVSRLRRQTDVLARQVERDPVTGAGNRELLVRSIGLALDRRPRRSALVLIGVERFTELRDVLGSRIADAALRELSERLKRVAGPSDSVARIGAATFGVLLDEAGTPDEHAAVARRLLDACGAPLNLFGLTLEVDSSAGMALLSERARSADELFERAETALSAAAGAPSRLVRFRAGHRAGNEPSPLLVRELPRALADGELVVHFQPQVEMDTGRVMAFEALVRWNHPAHGLLGPATFIPAAERTGLITRVTAYVLDAALAELARWRADGMDLAVAVNLSVHDLLDPGLVGEVGAALERHHVPPEKLDLELTETMAMVDRRRAVATLSGLAELGVKLSVDDFGTGYSSLGYLRGLPVSRLKIDRSFVAEMLDDRASGAIVAATIDLAGRLGLGVVAEGVEDEQTYAALAALGCDAAQGFWLSRPVPAGDVPGVVTALHGRVPCQHRGPAAHEARTLGQALDPAH